MKDYGWFSDIGVSYGAYQPEELDLVGDIEDICEDWRNEIEDIFDRLRDHLRFEVFGELRTWQQENRKKRTREELEEKGAYIRDMMHEYAESWSDETQMVFARNIYFEITRNNNLMWIPGQNEEITRPDSWKQAAHIYAASCRMHANFGFVWLLNIREEQVCEECR